MDTVIEVSGLVKTFGRARALDGLDLLVREGEIHGFLGPNGAGKSTTIRVLLGMLRPTSGSARLFGLDTWREGTAIRRRVAYVPGVVSIGGLASVLGCAAAIQSVLHLRTEELDHGEAMFATPPARWRWMLAAAAVGTLVGALALAVFSLLAGALLAASGRDLWGLVWKLFAADVVLVPLFAGVAALLVGLAPRIASWAAWLLLFGLMFVGDFLPLFGDVWDAAANLSPFRWVANPLADSPEWMPGLWMALGGLAAIGLGAHAFRRRDLLR